MPLLPTISRATPAASRRSTTWTTPAARMIAALAGLWVASPALAAPSTVPTEVSAIASAVRAAPRTTLSSLCPHPTEASVALWDGASLTWGKSEYTCDGERYCTFSLGDGNPGRFSTHGNLQIDMLCNADAQPAPARSAPARSTQAEPEPEDGPVARASLRLTCEHGTCTPEQLTVDNPAMTDQPYFQTWAPGPDGVSRPFLTVLHETPDALQAQPAPLTAEIVQLSTRLADVLASCGSLPCPAPTGAGAREVDWQGAGEAAAVLATLPVTITTVDRDTWGEAGWTAHYTAQAGLYGELDCFEFSGDCDLHAQACSLTVRHEGKELVSYNEPYAEVYEDRDPEWIHEARLDGLIVDIGGADGMGYLARRPAPATP